MATVESVLRLVEDVDRDWLLLLFLDNRDAMTDIPVQINVCGGRMTDPAITAICRLAQACEDAGMTSEQMLAMLREELSLVNLICLIERDEPPPVFVPNPTRWIV